MDRKFIVDKEINLKEGKNDFLKTKVYADNLVDVINNTDDGKVFTIGLFGSWGSGKSSIVTTAQDTLEKRKDKKIKFITYDAWQYANDSFRRMFLLKVKEELNFEDEDLLKGFYTHKSQDVEIKYRPSTNRMIFTIGIIIIAIIIIQFLPIEIDQKVNISSIFSIIGILLGIVLGAFNQLKISESKPLMFAPEQFEDCFKQMISKSLKKYNWIQKAGYVIIGDKTIKDIDKLVVVIDNIDRCNNDIAYTLLTDIKTFLGSEAYNIVFVIPVDDEALRKHILGNKKTATDADDCNKDKEEFLRKFFNVTIRIKPYGETDMFAFAKAIDDKYTLHFKNETLSLASKNYSTNPRRIIQLFNNLNAELNLYKNEPGFAEKNETLICSILILREEFNDLYKKILNKPSILTKNIEDEKDEKTNRFLRIIRGCVHEIDLNAVNKILSNSDNLFPLIPTDIKDAVQTNDTEKVVQFISNSDTNSSNTDSLFYYVFWQMDNAIANGLIETDFKILFDLILLINETKPIEKDINIRINEKYLGQIDSLMMLTTANHERLCYYAITQEGQGIHSLKDKMLDYVTNVESKKQTQWKNWFNLIIRQFQDKESAIKLRTTFIENKEEVDFTGLKLSTEQFTYMIDDEYITQIIDKLSSIDTATKEYKELLWLIENKKNISTETYSNIFSRSKTLFGDFNNKTKKQIGDLLHYLYLLVEKVPDKKLEKTKGYIDLCSEIFKNRIIQTRNEIQQIVATIYNNFIDETIQANQDSSIDELIKFIYNTYRITNDISIVTDAIKKLSKKYREKLNPIFIKLIEAEYSITALKETLIEDINYESTDSLQLIEYALCRTHPNTEPLSLDIAQTKIKDMLDYALEQKSEAVYGLISKLSKEETYKKQIVDIIKAKSSVQINSLPKNLLGLAIESFKKETYLEFKNNNEFLSVIAKNGNEEENRYLLKILEDRVELNNEMDATLNIIDEIPLDKYNYTEKKFLIARLNEYIENQNINPSDEIKERITNIIGKIKQ